MSGLRAEQIHAWLMAVKKLWHFYCVVAEVESNNLIELTGHCSYNFDETLGIGAIGGQTRLCDYMVGHMY